MELMTKGAIVRYESSDKGQSRNLAVGCQKLYGSNKKWKKRHGYHKRSLSETAMHRAEQAYRTCYA